MAGQARFASALRVPEFRALWSAELISVVGDQLARVGLSLLVYRQTSNAALTALTYALTFVPSILGGVFLSGLADRYPRRAVLVITDVVRAALAAAMAWPGLPLPALWVSVGLLSMAAGPFKAAQMAVLPQVLHGESYTAGIALRQFTGQIAQLVGFGGSGILLTFVEPHLALAINAATFVASALIVLGGVHRRPASSQAPASTEPNSGSEQPSTTGRLVALYAVVCLIGLYVVPEGLAAPYANGIGAAAFGVGLLMAADPIGSALGAWLTTRLRVPATGNAIIVLAAAAGLPLIASVFRPGLVVSMVLWAVSGMLSTAYLIKTQALVAELVPDHRRGTVMGRMATCLYASQGITILAGGLVAEVVGPFQAVAAAGLLAVVLALAIGVAWHAVRPRPGVAEGEPTARRHQSLLRKTSTSSQRTDRLADSAANGTTGEHGEEPAHSTSSMKAPGRRPKNWKLWALPTRVRVFVLIVEATALVLGVVLAVARPATSSDFARAGVLVGLGLITAEATRHIERLRRRASDTPHVNMSSVWTLAAALLTTPALAAAVAVVLYLHMWVRSWRRVRVEVHRTVFNVAAVSLACFAAAGVERVLPWHLLSLDKPSALVGLVIVIATYWVVNSSLVAGAIALSQDDRSLPRLLGSWSENSLEYATLSMGAMTAVLLAWHPWGVALVLPALYVLTRAVLIRQLEHATMNDAKTGLLNAASWHSLAIKELERAQRHRAHAAVLMIDLDHFKRVNDAYGEALGDEVLRAVGKSLRREVRTYDLCGRFGGEEIVLFLPDASVLDAEKVGQRVCAAVRTLRVSDPATEQFVEDLRLSVSIGAAAYPDHGGSLDEVLLAADNALYLAKDSGRDRVCAVKPGPEDTEVPTTR
ncbi:MFS transporter [Amycolatopsis acidicola]|uniref:MFS transporter n=2 Tax=Amycolatopsis acidicola TaxID=2596893 RepID=A0A5N0V2W9_9PSEU|nr:MFS transporter [Amycolatopsis acidicola]